MAIGGGAFLTQNKSIPGAYINFISAGRVSDVISDRGVTAMPLALDWGADNAVFTVDSATFKRESLKYFGYEYSNEKLKGLRDLFKNTRIGHFYKLNTNGTKAENVFGQAVYNGTRGNYLKIIIEANEYSTTLDKIYDVSTVFDTDIVDTQTVRTAIELKPNDFINFNPNAILALTAGTPLIGGKSGLINITCWQAFLDRIESYSFNVLGCTSDDDTIKGLFAAFTKRLRVDLGIKFQCVVHRLATADFEGVISVENNGLTDLVYWVTGAAASCAINASNTNKVYDGEFIVDTNYTQSQLEHGCQSGKLMLHKVGDSIRILDDINTFTSISVEKNVDFSSNQTIRILDQIGNDIALLFNKKYLGKVPNNNAGRISLWNDVVKHHKELQLINAIEDFKPDQLIVSLGDSKKSVTITDYVTPVNAMSQLYMTILVS